MASIEELKAKIAEEKKAHQLLIRRMVVLQEERQLLTEQLKEEREAHLETIAELENFVEENLRVWEEAQESIETVATERKAQLQAKLAKAEEAEKARAAVTTNINNQNQEQEQENASDSTENKEEATENEEADEKKESDATVDEETNKEESTENEAEESSNKAEDGEETNEKEEQESESESTSEEKKEAPTVPTSTKPKATPPVPGGKPSRKPPLVAGNQDERSRGGSVAPQLKRDNSVFIEEKREKPKPPAGRFRPAPPSAGGRSFKNPVIDLKDKKLTELSAEEHIKDNSHINTLGLSRNQLTTLPEEMKQLTSLTKLDISYNQMSVFPSTILPVAMLKEINICGNRITEFPEEFATSFTSLTKIDAGNNNFDIIPTAIAKLANLKHLELNRNKLSDLGDVEALSSLEFIGLKCNNFKTIPDSLLKLETIKQVMLPSNQLESLPDDWSGLVNLEELDISSNSITAIPDSIAASKTLQKLNARHNKLTALPATWGQGEEYAFSEIRLGHNNITALPAGIYCIGETLGVLEFMSNEVAEISPDVQNLYNLLEFVAPDNKLTSLPEEIGYLEYLTTLNVAFNQLTELPASIENLYSIQYLFVCYNELSALPELTNCAELYELFISGNKKISEFPASVWTLKSIGKIYASDMSLTEIPADIANIAESLEILDICYNEISKLPDEFEELRYLKRIAISHNKISELPILDDMYEVSQLDISYNAFTTLPEDVERFLDRGCEVLLDGNDSLEGDKPEKAIHIHSSPRWNIGIGDMIGKRPTMEDAMAIQGDIGVKHEEDGADFFGLYDGHAGREAATFCGEHVHNEFFRFLKEAKEGEEAVDSDKVLDCLIKSYSSTNILFKEHLAKTGMGSTMSKYCGTTAVSLFIKDNKCYLVNVGDSRAVLYRKNEAVRLSFDHKPYDQVEEERVRKLGGYIVGDMGRVNGLLAVSRSIGDFYMHPYVIDTPYSTIIDLNEEDDRYIILACDGVWDEVSDERAAALLGPTPDPFRDSCKLRDFAYVLGSDDNISVMIVTRTDNNNNNNDDDDDDADNK